MDTIILYRKRLIPNENIKLTSDKILCADSEKIITKWNCIHPRNDMDHGYSLYLLNKGVKISKFCKKDGSLFKWYCDIVDYSYDSTENSYTSLDLLLDVTVDPLGRVKVLDMDELVMAHKDKLLNDDLLHLALLRANDLLSSVYSGKFSEYTSIIDSYIK
ncbi:MAG: DUF402 domain-containing protein [Lachnospiraceae bacterium]|nr:DUF402 domain-containing protein [Lachnospiraceae bacterium]